MDSMLFDGFEWDLDLPQSSYFQDDLLKAAFETSPEQPRRMSFIMKALENNGLEKGHMELLEPFESVELTNEDSRWNENTAETQEQKEFPPLPASNTDIDRLAIPTPSNLQAAKLHVGNWKADNVEVKILFGRRKVKYCLVTNDKRLMIDYDFSHVIGLWIDESKKLLKIELSTTPHFAEKKDGKWTKTPDFTDGNATAYKQHFIFFTAQAFTKHISKLLQTDDRLRGLITFSTLETNFTASPTFKGTNLCDWDKENICTIHCEECGANYCEDCDDVLHRPPEKKSHIRVAMNVHNLKTNKKRKKKDTCRCGTGATRNTLGCPCTGNRCPCFSEDRKCIDCGCKNCANPFNKKDKDKDAKEKDSKDKRRIKEEI